MFTRGVKGGVRGSPNPYVRAPTSVRTQKVREKEEEIHQHLLDFHSLNQVDEKESAATRVCSSGLFICI